METGGLGVRYELGVQVEPKVTELEEDGRLRMKTECDGKAGALGPIHSTRHRLHQVWILKGLS